LTEPKIKRILKLYENHKIKKEKIEDLKEKNKKEIDIKINTAHINKKSNQIINEIQTKLYVHLFQILSDKNTNLVNADSFDINYIHNKIKFIFIPLINELKEQNESLNLNEFIIASKHIYSSLPLQLKQILIDYYLSINKSKKFQSVLESMNYPFKVV